MKLQALQVLATALATFLVTSYWQSRRKFAGHKDHSQAFWLVVNFHFNTEAGRDEFKDIFTPLALHVAKHEKGTLAYELSVADTDPTKILIFERYVTKEYFIEVHRKSEPFLLFKKKLAGIPHAVTGQSYIEADLGFMRS